MSEPDYPIPRRGNGVPSRTPARNTTTNPNNNGIVSDPPIVVKRHVTPHAVCTATCISSARAKIRLFVGRLSTAVMRSRGIRSRARVGLRFAQLRDISAEPGDNGECAEVDLFKEFGFYVDPTRDS
jgi:hypothetical protein